MTTKKSLAAIVMLGDVMLGRLVDEALSSMPEHSAIWGDTLPFLRGGMSGDPATQLNTANLECAVTDHQRPAPKTFNFKLSTSNVGVLNDANIRFVSLANNHSLDYFEQGLVESVQVLTDNGIACAGVGTADEAAKPAIVEHGGTKVAFLCYSDHYEEWRATPIYRGINYINPGKYDRSKINAQLQDAARVADLVIVFIHWGPNWSWRPSKDIQQLAHDFIDGGADAVFGHSSHHVQGIEIRNGKPIVYGAGGFVDDYALDESYRNDLGFLYCLHLESGYNETRTESPASTTMCRPRELELVPTKINHEWRKHGSQPPYYSFVRRAVGEDRAWLLRTMRRLCSDFGTVMHDAPRGFRIPLF